MVFIMSWNLNAFVSTALKPKLLDIDFLILICSLMKPRPLSVDSNTCFFLYPVTLPHASHSTVSTNSNASQLENV